MNVNHRTPARAASSPSALLPKPATHQQIAALAHELWLAAGRPMGVDLDYWFAAERELVQGIPPGPRRDPVLANGTRLSPPDTPAA